MKHNILTIGADLGNDSFKIIGPTKRELMILNTIAPWHVRRVISEDTRYPMNLLEVEVMSKHQILGKYFVGGMAYSFNRGILKERGVADRHVGKANDDATTIVLLTSIAVSLMKPNVKKIKEKIFLGSMLPTEEYFKNNQEDTHLLEEKLIGIHKIRFLNPVFNGVEVEFEIMGIVIQPEGYCAINAIMYDDNGDLLSTYKNDYSEQTIVGFDIGALTSDIIVTHNFELRTFFGIEKGTIDPLNRISDQIKTDYKVTVPRHKIDSTIIKNEKLLIYGEEIPNFLNNCNEIIDYEGKLLIDEFASKSAASGVQLPDIGLLILCGGGSLLFKNMISMHLSRIPMIFSENALMLNAIGAWKIANKYKNEQFDESPFGYVAISHE